MGVHFSLFYKFIFKFFQCFPWHFGLGPVPPPGCASSPPSSWLLPSILSAARAVLLRFCRSPFLLCGFLLVSRAAQSAVKSIARAMVVCLGEQAGLLPPPALSRTYLPSPHPFSFPRLNFLDSEQARSSLSIINFFFSFLFIFHAFSPTIFYSRSRQRMVVAAGGRRYGTAQPGLWTSPFDKLSSPGPAQGFDQSALSTPWKTLNTLPDPFLCLHL